MKHNNAKKPTRKQRIFLSSCRLNYENWLVITETKEEMKIINRFTGHIRILPKFSEV